MEHQPDTDEDNGLIKDLDEVVVSVSHRLDTYVECKQQGAEDIDGKYLQDNGEAEEYNNQCKYCSPHKEIGRIHQCSSIVIVDIQVDRVILGFDLLFGKIIELGNEEVVAEDGVSYIERYQYHYRQDQVNDSFHTT